ncbi:MAG: O-antigen ligase family protein [Planctomycetes bacterium]|nr:O-antigen ligase family protein [Planctomycetota bacterium]
MDGQIISPQSRSTGNALVRLKWDKVNKQVPYGYIFLFFIAYYIGTELSIRTGIYSFRILGLMPGVYFLLKKMRFIVKTGIGSRRNKLFYLALFVMALLHVRGLIMAGITSVMTVIVLLGLLIHILFWAVHGATVRTYDEFNRLLYYLTMGFLLTFMVVALIPMNLLGNFSIGGHYNLEGADGLHVPFITTSIEPPLWSAIVVVLSLTILLGRWGYHRYNPKINIFYLPTGASLMILLIGLMEIFLINKRGPIFALFLALCVALILPFLLKSKLIYLIPLFVLLPLAWTFIATFMLPVIQSPVVQALVTRTGVENITSATGRIVNWAFAFNHLLGFEWNADYLLGVGNLEEYWDMGPYGHAHNSLLQLLIQTGVLGAVINASLIYNTLYKIRYSYLRDTVSSGSQILFTIFILLIFLTATESLFLTIYFTNLLFIAVIILIDVHHRLVKKMDST